MQRVWAKSSEKEICWENYEWFSAENFVGWWEWQDIKWWNGRTSLAVQWLTFWVSTAENVGSIPGQGTKIPQGERCGQKRRKKIERKWKYLKKNWIGLPRWLSGKESACQTRDSSSIPGLGWSSRVANGYPLQYSCPGNPMDRGIWQATVHRTAKNWTWLIGKTTATITINLGFPSEESTCQWRRHRFDLWSRKITHATWQWWPSTAMNKTDKQTKAGYVDREPDLFFFFFCCVGCSCSTQDLHVSWGIFRTLSGCRALA